MYSEIVAALLTWFDERLFICRLFFVAYYYLSERQFYWATFCKYCVFLKFASLWRLARACM
jgi:hypothetical protein